jgi:hypothetical protein
MTFWLWTFENYHSIVMVCKLSMFYVCLTLLLLLTAFDGSHDGYISTAPGLQMEFWWFWTLNWWSWWFRCWMMIVNELECRRRQDTVWCNLHWRLPRCSDPILCSTMQYWSFSEDIFLGELMNVLLARKRHVLF